MKVEPTGQHHLVLTGYETQGHRDSVSPNGLPPEHLEEIDTSKAEMRKSNKPIMEKRRRARINNCLNDLKGILLEAMRKDPARHSKLEKADILELTVRHLQNVQRNQLAIAMATDPTVLHRFKNGFAECTTEVSRYLGRLELADPGIKTRVTAHLTGCVNGLQQVTPTVGNYGGTTRYAPPPSQPQPIPNVPVGQLLSPVPHSVPFQHLPSQQLMGTNSSPGDVNNNAKNHIQKFEFATPIMSPSNPIHRSGSLSAFTSVSGGPGSLIISPMSTSSNETLNASLSSGSDSSSLSYSSEKTNNTSPIDFSLKAPTTPSNMTGGQVRVLKVEPLGKRPRLLHHTPVTSTQDKGHMWRPW